MQERSASRSSSDDIDAPHAVEPQAALVALGVAADRGLASAEVAARQERYGLNRMPSSAPRSLWRLLADQFASLIVLLLVVAGAISWAMGERVEAAAIVVVLAVNALIGFFTEWQARRALEALQRETRTIARVRRDGREMSVEATQLVPGDILLLAAGDRVPADARLIEASGLRTEEAALTGESAAVDKDVAAVDAQAPLAERSSCVFLGTSVVAGRALALVTSTGERTQLGIIGLLVARAEKQATPLEAKLGELGQRLVYLVMGIASVVFLVGLTRGGELWELARVAISLAVAAVPEGLPAVTTLVLAMGVLRMARRQAIVRRLPAVETLGSTTVICTDKTGTLTQNRMTVRLYRLADGMSFASDDEAARLAGTADGLLGRAVRVTVLDNEASWDATAVGNSQAVGDPTETALLDAAARLGVDIERLRADFPLVHEIPFDSISKRMVTVHRAAASLLAALKGAPGAVLDRCSHYAAGPDDLRPLDDATRARFRQENNEMAGEALRVLALAEKTLPDVDRFDLSPAELDTGYTYLGLVGMIDPPRPEAKEALRRARAAGVRTVMLTGDQIDTAGAIARELELGDRPREPRTLHARDLEGSDRERLLALARTVDVFARVSPEDKLRIVESLQQAGEIVAVTGDGVNDAPALKKADIGVAMGQRGTEVAKEAADIVLADDNFATIVRAIEGGRTIYTNILKFVHYLFTCNLTEVLLIFVAIALGWPLPLLPLQILWVNLVTDVFPAFALSVEPPEPDAMRRPPRSPQEALLSRSFLILIGWQSGLLAVVVLGTYVWALGIYGAGPQARTVTLMALVGVQLAQLINCRSLTDSGLAHVRANPMIASAALTVIVLQVAAVYLPTLARVLGVVPPQPRDWVVVFLSVVLPIALVEGIKSVIRRRDVGRAAGIPGR